MDPKNLPTLDPKLKEAYERVMNTTIAPTASSQPPIGQMTTPQTTIPQATTIPTPQPIPQQPTSNALPHATVASSQNHGSTFVAGTHPSQGAKVSPVLLVIAGVAFFAVYTIFWLKFFNIPLPFLP